MSSKRRTAVSRECQQCSAPFWASAVQVKRGHGKFCSRACYHEERYPRPIPEATSLDGVVRVPVYGPGGVMQAYTLVDEADVEIAVRERWLLNRGYARASKRANGRNYGLLLHRLLLGLAHGDKRQCDHINQDKLDNRRANLRIVTHAQNGQNVRGHPRSSKYRGVSWSNTQHKWIVYVKVNGKTRRIGAFDLEEAAAQAASAARRQLLPYSSEDVVMSQSPVSSAEASRW